VSLGFEANNANNVQVMVKAYANMNGLAQACVRDGKVQGVADMSQFWIGFSRRYPLMDFVDVGSGKEEADNKIRGMKFCMSPSNCFGLTNIQKFCAFIYQMCNASMFYLLAVTIRDISRF